MFRHLKKHISGQIFNTKEQLKEYVLEYIDSHQPPFFAAAFSERVLRWQKCVENNGSYIEK